MPNIEVDLNIYMPKTMTFMGYAEILYNHQYISEQTYRLFFPEKEEIKL